MGAAILFATIAIAAGSFMADRALKQQARIEKEALQ